MIIGVSAKKQGGKSTFIKILQSRVWTCKVVRFADKLKEIIIDCFVPSEWNWKIDDLDDDANKNKVLPCGKTVRNLLQVVGTEWFRHTWEDCWINAYDKTVSPGFARPCVILTPDVRFPNELRYIQEHGGKVVRLTRSPQSYDPHESETALDPAMWATILHWDKFNVEQSIDHAHAIQKNIPWVISMMDEKLPCSLTDMRLIWDRCPVLFDQVIDNRGRTEEEQKHWVLNWINKQ